MAIPADVSAVLPSSKPGKFGNIPDATRRNMISSNTVIYSEKNRSRISYGSCKRRLTVKVVAAEHHYLTAAGSNVVNELQPGISRLKYLSRLKPAEI